MDWLSKIRDLLPNIGSQRRSIVRMDLVDSYDLEECIPKIIRRERPFWREHGLDSYHLKADGTIEHKSL